MKHPRHNLLQRHPALKAVIDYLLKRVWERIELLAATLVMSLVLTMCRHQATHEQIWSETGDHFQDLVRQVQMLEMQANGHIETNNLGK